MKIRILRSPLTPSAIFYYLGLLNWLSGRAQGFSSEDFNSSPHIISLVEFQGLLHSEVNGEIEAIQEEEHQKEVHGNVTLSGNQQGHRLHKGSYLQKQQISSEAEDLWNKVLQHGWDMSQTTISSNNKYRYNRQKRKQNIVIDEIEPTSAFTYPFLVCSHSSLKNKSGFQRLEPLLNRTGVLFEDVSVVFNAPQKTCFHVSLTKNASQGFQESIKLQNSSGDHYTIAPMTDLMKIQADTMKQISDDAWTIPRNPSPNDWERLIRVSLSASHRNFLTEDDVKAIVFDIFDDIKSLGQTGARIRRNRRLKEGKNSAGKYSRSLSSMFSLTAPIDNGVEEGYLRRNSSIQTPTRGRLGDWNSALQLGLEADHLCQNMFDTLGVSTHYGNKGFDIILNPSNSDGIESKLNPRGESEIDDDGIESQCGVEDCSALNKHCVVSLIMALSIHPLVLSIEAEDPVMSSDYESQWITQSRIEGKRPLKDILGIDGTNQILTIVDTGVDIDNIYFGPTNKGVFDGWDHSQRKVVRYDHNNGDKTEPKGGHGTKVACVAAGKFDDLDDVKANGIAEGAKLHIYDISHPDKPDKLRMVNVPALFESMHSTNKDAKIANLSFITPYRAYPTFCEQIDSALYGDYQGDLIVAGAGNSGFDKDTVTSVPRTIGNPASCKNSLGVGASHRGLDVHGKEIDYLAAFSSRGPTADNRIKPDLIAPGVSILTAYAHEDGRTVQVSGTSFAAPVVTGNAALVRQYFEDGNLPCSWANSCNMNPSGSLVKAVLLNSAQNIEAVQVSQSWLDKKTLETVSEYDSNQGMGLVQLDKSLPIPGHNKFSALVRNNKVINNKDVHDIFIRATPGKCFNKPYKHDFSATLTWYDPPGAIGCAKCLINDLDLIVHWISANGKVKYGSRVFPNGGTEEDDTNNVERVRFKMTSTRRYRIRVRAANLATAHQKFSFIATGCFRVISNPASS